MREFSLQATLLAGGLAALLIGYFALTGRFGDAGKPALAATAAYAAMIGASLAVAHFVCGALIGGRIAREQVGLGAVLLFATAFAAFVLILLKGFNLLLLGTGGPNSLPHFVNLGVALVVISWASWLLVYRRELRRRLKDEWADSARGR